MTGHIHLTPLGGMAGDMFVAAMLHALPDLAEAVAQATAAVLPGANAASQDTTKAGLAARLFHVPGQGGDVPLHYPDMDGMLAAARVPAVTRDTARALLRLLAQAEAAVHGTPLEKVHFHEIADWDTLADLTAAAAIFTALDGYSFSLDPLPLGGGTINTAHGHLPVPAPATAHLLQGLAVHDDGVPGERVTPTGAAIARYIHLHLPLKPRPMGRLQATGYGAGTRELPGVANVLVAQVIALPIQDGDSVAVLEWDIDDMTGEEIAVASDHLRGTEGVIDLVTVPLSGKKGRGATGFRALVRPGFRDAVAQAVFDQTSTLGVRLRQEQRLILPRDVQPGRKIALRPGGQSTKAESDAIAPGATLAARRAQARKVEE